MTPRNRLVVGVVALVLAAAAASPAGSAYLPERTFSMSSGVNGIASDGASSRPVMSDRGDIIAFDSIATNLALDPNGTVRDVFARDVVGNVTRLISEVRGGANGTSRAPAISASGSVIAFESDASNLVSGDANGQRDVFARIEGGPIVRISVTADGTEANGPSSQADVSADGSRIVFTSAASNLVADDVNGVEDVFLRDLRAGTITRISVRPGGGSNGASRAPAISPDGRYVSFASEASNLTRGDRNEIGDVFLVHVATGRIERVSVSTRSTEQNRSVVAPFVQISDVSRGGRYVVFDSDATNLVAGDTNRDTDIFIRDTGRRFTVRISVDSAGQQTDNDSFYPVFSATARFVAFQSFAANLSADDAPGQDTFVFDAARRQSTLVSVASTGRRRGTERVRQIVQRPAISVDGQAVAFMSTASNLVSGDANRVEDVFLRLMAAPRARFRRAPRSVERTARPRLSLSADDPAATRFHCTVDQQRFRCGRSGRLPHLQPGRHTLRVRAGGPGMLFQEKPLVRRFLVRR